MAAPALNAGAGAVAVRLPAGPRHAQDGRMTGYRSRHLLTIALLAAMTGASAADVTIYRCTDAQGRLTLRDTPCRAGERQQTRAMLRPSDPAPRPAAKPAPATALPAAAAPPRVIVVHAPRPLYECVSDDGRRYTSETAEGNPRWVPLAVLGYPVYPGIGGYSGQRHGYGSSGRLEYRSDTIRGRIDLGHPGPPGPYPPHRPPTHPLPIGGGLAYPAGTWIRDVCHALPPQEVCSRLRDHRYELDRRYNSALQSERTRITTEQRGIDARLTTDCGVN